MKIFDQIQFHRVHRLGKYERLDDAPGPITAKYERYKGREYVRSMAPKTLTGKSFGVRELFPKVVEDRRKLLYPEMDRARANKNSRVSLVRDQLFISNFEYVPTEKPAGQQNEIRSDYHPRRNGTNPRWAVRTTGQQVALIGHRTMASCVTTTEAVYFRDQTRGRTITRANHNHDN